MITFWRGTIKVNVTWNIIDEFNEYWARENLPLLEEHGARHIGSYVNLVGGLSMKLSVYLSLRIFHIGKGLKLSFTI
jgi:hypothetical protein